MVNMMMMTMMTMMAGQETMKRFAEPMLRDLDWGGRNEATLEKLAKKFRLTGSKEDVEKALENMNSFDEVEAAVRDSDSRAGTVVNRQGE
jgi:hypothetical protein